MILLLACVLIGLQFSYIIFLVAVFGKDYIVKRGKINIYHVFTLLISFSISVLSFYASTLEDSGFNLTNLAISGLLFGALFIHRLFTIVLQVVTYKKRYEIHKRS